MDGNNTTTNTNLDNLEQSITTLIDKYHQLKSQFEQLHKHHQDLRANYEKLVDTNRRVENRVKHLLDRITTVD